MVSAAGAMVDVTDDVTVPARLDFQLYTNDGSPEGLGGGHIEVLG